MGAHVVGKVNKNLDILKEIRDVSNRVREAGCTFQAL
jgi:hypothetical protein